MSLNTKKMSDLKKKYDPPMRTRFKMSDEKRERSFKGKNGRKKKTKIESWANSPRYFALTKVCRHKDSPLQTKPNKVNIRAAGA